MTRLRDESGFTLIELLVASVLSLIILSATLAVFESMVRQRGTIERQSEVETQARQGSDQLARQLRNLASPADTVTSIATSTLPKAVDRNLSTDLIFKDVANTRVAGSLNSANVRRVRYCLQSSGAVPGGGFSASATREVLWVQYQTWTTAAAPAMPPDTACPGTGWTSQRMIADRLVNTATSPVFLYSGDSGLITGTTDPDKEMIMRVETSLLVDADPAKPPAAVKLTSGVVLRNQNRAPVATMVYTLLNPVTCSIQLNGSASQDPESKPLTYEWYIDGIKQTETGVVIQKTVAKGTHSYQLKVYDPAALVGASTVENQTC